MILPQEDWRLARFVIDLVNLAQEVLALTPTQISIVLIGDWITTWPR